MAATPSGIARSRPSYDRPLRSGSTPAAPIAAVVTGGIALASAAAGLAIAQAYPIAPLVVLAAFVAWAAFAFVRFSLALPAMLALLPMVGFAPTTGWLTFEEFDLLVLASSAGGYAALCVRSMSAMPDANTRNAPRGPALSIFSIVLAALFLVSLTVALQRGFEAAGGFRFDWTQGYVDPLNSLRIYKSFVWALLIAPLLQAELRKAGGFDRLGLGMTAALGFVGLAVLQERFAFVGLLDFSDDYRVTAPFWEMHVGGAALDGFLALTIPFAVRDALRHPVADVDGIGAGRAIGDFERGRMVVAWLVLALAAYACLVTFSRGVYAAVPLSMLLLVVLVFRQRLRLDRRALWPLLAKGALFAALVACCSYAVFRGGGYRAVLAVFVVLAVGIPIEASIRQTSIGAWLTAAVAAAIAGLVGFLLAQVLPKGPYLVFGIALVVSVAAVVRIETNAARFSATIPRSLAMLAITAWLWLALCAVLVAFHWGGPKAGLDSAIVLAAIVGLAFAASRLTRSVWPEPRREQIATIGFAALVMGSVAVFTAGAYMGGRFSTSRSDLDLRIAHWTEGIARLRGADDWLLGKGLGRFPATSLFESSDGTVPGSYRADRRDGERFLALTTPKMRYFSFDEFFRVSQRVSVRPRTTYVVTAQVRSPTPASLHIELCEKQLLYHGSCVDAERTTTDAPGWQALSFPLFTGPIGGSPWYASRPVFLALASVTGGAVLEIRDLHAIGPDGHDIVANGDFTDGAARWFSSSDKYHLPWHIKNIALDVLFDQGVIGLALFTLLAGGAFLRTTVGRAFRHPDAPYVAAGIAGYLVVGAFDSLLDVPRVAFAFYLVVLVGLMLRPRVAGPAKAPVKAPSRSVDPPRVEDEAAARARRRQRAFGERVLPR